MFDGLTGRLGEIFDKLTRRGSLSEADVRTALREVRVALLDADVALPVVRTLIDRVQAAAVGAQIVRSVSPGQMVVKLVHDALVEALGTTVDGLALAATPPMAYLMVGLQGAGKTTTTAKIGRLLVEQHGKRVLLASLDVRRPAAREQLRVLGDQALVPTLDILAGESPLAIAGRAMDKARHEGVDVVLLDTAGRLTVDDAMMAEIAAVAKAVRPVETLLVGDAMTGQDAVATARAFHQAVQLTGIVLTRVDGDSRGGAALSMRAVTGCPIKLMGVGEKLDALEPFHPERIAGRILGQGDVVSLVEKAAATIDDQEASRMAAKLQDGRFDLEDMAAQLAQIRKMGGLGGLMGFLPGVGKIKRQMAEKKVDEALLRRQEAILRSMTPVEKRRPAIIKASRKRRIAHGSGVSIQEVNRLLKQHRQMQTTMKRMRKLGDKGAIPPDLAGLPGVGSPGTGLPGASFPGMGSPGGLR